MTRILRLDSNLQGGSGKLIYQLALKKVVLVTVTKPHSKVYLLEPQFPLLESMAFLTESRKPTFMILVPFGIPKS